MNPLDFWWKEDQQVTVTNPTADDFSFKVHGKAYLMPAGKTAKMPGFIAWVYVYMQAVKAAQVDGKFERWNDEDLRTPYYEKFVAGVEELVTFVDEPEPDVHTFDNADDAAHADPPPNTGVNYTPNQETGKKSGRPSRV